MIRNQWYAVLESNEVRPGRPVGVTRLGEKLVFWRTSAGQIVCMRDLCPHIGARLSQGKVTGDALACPFHGFEYDASGQCTHLPAYGANGDIPRSLKVGVYPTAEVAGYIWIWWGEAETPPAPPVFFDSIGPDFSHSRFQQHWPVHYSRMAENQLDVAHLAFVHHNTIGRGGTAQIRIQNDSSISKENMALVAFDARTRKFFFAAGDGRNLIYINDELLLPHQSRELRAYDRILLGRSTLLFMPLCGGEFSWE